ncbi:NAD(P)/FAD-dependent oxidoreductase [Prochlorococcus marinus]|uniref:FAD-binding oxidoreductase n=1 Tax=Prochlorococcus marinus XMU1408 TaxID=2213228 RepID=A0A318QW71_PROMR|nr:FAD-dependent oxidoreductase [Prochlorococcus marinus]MBW3042963.1 FAD-binding oxidoreductase [Prochlorococcus marinus str. XMU1408]PYE00315.1 FAD-binding oxidoreductase [Prochlorococcus marinus XMU1408]
MNNLKAKKNPIEISVIGSGIAGITTAFHLGQKGYKVNLIDPKVNSEINNINPLNGSQAALGVLMGNSYKRTKGRAFFLRKKSMELWKDWLIQLDYSRSSIALEKPLIKLASSAKEYQSMIEISKNKKEYGIELLDEISLEFWSSIFEKQLIGGLISHEDGRLNPIKLIRLIMSSLDNMKVNKIERNVIRIKNNKLSNKNWQVYFENNEYMNQDYIVICSALNTEKLLKPLGHEIHLEPILGQVFELELKDLTTNWYQWPAILNYQSINFIHHDPNHILMGATIENGTEPNLKYKQEMLDMNKDAPKWIRKARISHQWSGIRARPRNEPAPLLKELEPGLLINTGHYRNGILLAPSCAEWIGLKINRC